METSAGDVSLDGNTLAQLNSPDSKALLDTIDQLRQLQIGEIISLPQIVVVGDQSSGKSSVLEALSRVRFPVDGDVCTRFATELVLRRASEPRVDVSIQFSDRTAGKRDSPQQPFRRTEFDTEALPDIINEAKEHMGIRIRGERRFSKDVLRVEISGPDVYPLTLVDLPGYFHSETADQSQEDLELVNELVEGYMKQDKSIILAVVAANNQLANQIVTKQAKKHDPARERTLGVITKPDLAGSGNNRRRYLDLAQGLETTHELRLGWFVLRNQSEEERTASFEERDRNEKRFFESGPWSAIRRTNRGIESLRRKLSTVLLDHIKANLPGLIRDIEHNLETRRQQLQQLGEPRSTSRELRSYLFDIAERFHNLTDDALEGRYNDQFFGTMDDEDKKLRALIRNLNRAFDAVLRMKGGTHEIEEEDHDQRKSHGHNKAEASRDEDGMVDEYLQRFVNLYSSFPNPAPITQSALNKRLELPASRNQGREFPGVPNSNLAFQLFREEAKPWKDIAQFYIDLVLSYAQSFVEKLFEYIIGSDRTTIAAVLRSCVNPFFDQKKRVLREKLHEILRPYVNGYTLPLETEFHGRLSRRTLNRLADRLAGVLGDDDGLDTILVKSGSRPRRKQALETLLNAESFMNSHLGTDDVVDMMVTYYDMSLRTFTENVINLAVEGCLVCDLPSILTTRKVDKMPDDILRELALESEEVQIERQILQEEVKMLEEALTRCNRHRPIQMTVPPSIVCVSPRPEKKQNPSNPEPSVPAAKSPEETPLASRPFSTAKLNGTSQLATPSNATKAVPPSATKSTSTGFTLGAGTVFPTTGLFKASSASKPSSDPPTTSPFGPSLASAPGTAPSPTGLFKASSASKPSTDPPTTSPFGPSLASAPGTAPSPTGLFGVSSASTTSTSNPTTGLSGASSASVTLGSTNSFSSSQSTSSPWGLKPSNKSPESSKGKMLFSSFGMPAKPQVITDRDSGSRLTVLTCAGLETVPLAEGGGGAGVRLHNLIPVYPDELMRHICAEDALAHFSAEELRLSYLVWEASQTATGVVTLSS